MNIEEGSFDPKPTGPAGYSWNISPWAFGWAATAAILICYAIGINLVLAFFADSVSTDNVEISTPNLFTASIIGQILFLLLPALVFARIGPLPMREALRLRRAPVSFFLLASFGMIACQILGALWLMIQELYLVPDALLADYAKLQENAEWLNNHLLFGGDVPLLLFAVVAVGFVPAVSEELVFRGIVQRSFEERLKPVVAILLSAIIFGAIHFQPTNFIPLSGVGAFLGLTAWASRSIWPGVFGHFLFNGSQVILSNLADVSFDELERTPTPADLYAILPVATISLIALVSIVRQLQKMRKVGEPSPTVPSVSEGPTF